MKSRRLHFARTVALASASAAIALVLVPGVLPLAGATSSSSSSTTADPDSILAPVRENLPDFFDVTSAQYHSLTGPTEDLRNAFAIEKLNIENYIVNLKRGQIRDPLSPQGADEYYSFGESLDPLRPGDPVPDPLPPPAPPRCAPLVMSGITGVVSGSSLQIEIVRSTCSQDVAYVRGSYYPALRKTFENVHAESRCQNRLTIPSTGLVSGCRALLDAYRSKYGSAVSAFNGLITDATANGMNKQAVYAYFGTPSSTTLDALGGLRQQAQIVESMRQQLLALYAQIAHCKALRGADEIYERFVINPESRVATGRRIYDRIKPICEVACAGQIPTLTPAQLAVLLADPAALNAMLTSGGSCLTTCWQANWLPTFQPIVREQLPADYSCGASLPLGQGLGLIAGLALLAGGGRGPRSPRPRPRARSSGRAGRIARALAWAALGSLLTHCGGEDAAPPSDVNVASIPPGTPNGPGLCRGRATDCNDLPGDPDVSDNHQNAGNNVYAMQENYDSGQQLICGGESGIACSLATTGGEFTEPGGRGGATNATASTALAGSADGFGRGGANASGRRGGSGGTKSSSNGGGGNLSTSPLLLDGPQSPAAASLNPDGSAGTYGTAGAGGGGGAGVGGYGGAPTYGGADGATGKNGQLAFSGRSKDGGADRGPASGAPGTPDRPDYFSLIGERETLFEIISNRYQKNEMKEQLALVAGPSVAAGRQPASNAAAPAARRAP